MTDTNALQENRVNILWFTLMLIVYVLYMSLLSPDIGDELIRDTGFVSVLNILLILVAFIFSISLLFKAENSSLRKTFIALTYVILIYAAREADFHRIFTDEHTTRWKFYVNSEIPFAQRGIAGSIMIVFFLAAAYLVWNHFLAIWKTLLEKNPITIAFFLWGITLFSSQVCDKTILNDIYYGRVLEEFLEFTAAGYAILAIHQYSCRNKQNEKTLDYGD